MQRTDEIAYDAATSIEIGRRERQEDALASDFSSGQAFGFVVLADGMGGHAAGDVASKIVVTKVFSELKLQAGDPNLLEHCLGDVLKSAALNANRSLGQYAREHADTSGMGSTLLAPVLVEDRLYWVSVGDSPLYLFRDGILKRLNENHALYSQIEYLVSTGIMNREEALSYPDQTCLTSVLIGERIAQLDCPPKPQTLVEGDILIAASDGLQFISEEQIAGVLRFQQKSSAQEISAALTREIKNLDDPNQDNVSLCVIKVLRKNCQLRSNLDLESATRSDDARTESITILARITRGKKTATQR